MNSLCWNCRGIGNPRTVHALGDYVRRWNPKLVFLSETKLKVRRMEKVKFRLGFPNGLIVPSRGRSGGLALLWSVDTNLEIKSFSNHHIDAIITESGNGLSWRFTGFYGYPETHLREDSWKLLYFLCNQFNLPWFCCGDFNEILSMNEKTGGTQRSQSQMDSFRNVVNFCGFKDLGFCGPEFTWCNMKEGSDRISLRLDRAFATSDWLEYFKSPKVHHLVESTSDHCILTITDSPPPARKNKRRFHFEAMWVKREDCREVIKAAWDSGALFVTPEGVASNLKRCADALTTWNQNVVGNISKQIQEKRKALNSLTMNDQHGSRGADINHLRKEINDLLDSEETIWRQRSKVHWYKEGDRNTKFFHARASERRRKNTILGLWNDNGEWCESKESITAIAISYFENIYSTSFPTGIEEITNAVPRRVTEEMNAELTKVFTRDEVTKALQQLHPTKAPGPDGMSAIFYHKYWDIVGSNITNMVLNVLNSNLPMTEINKTNISLIPKTNHPTKMTDFRPISLCNTTYKLISKVLANRFKTILPSIISENQSAFTPDRLITDNVLVAFEFMHYLNHKNDGKENYMSIKLDMSKAFDRVEWNFIKGVMVKLGFANKWIDLIMHCVSSVSYSVIINGEAQGNIIPSRGIR